MGVIGNLMFAVGFKVGTDALKSADKQVSGLKKGVLAFGAAGLAAMGTFAIATMNSAANFESAMGKVQGATGQTAEQMEATRSVAESLYSKNFGDDWDDLGSAIATTNQITKQTGDELEKTTKNALLLKEAYGYEIAESVKTADTMMKTFGATSEQSMNLLAQGTQNGLDKSGDLLDTANEYSNHFKSLGFTVDGMFDTLAAGSQNGAFSVDKVGDAVKEFNIRSKDGSKTSTEAFQMLGLDADKMFSTFAAGGPTAQKSFTKVMQMISDIEDPVARNTVGVALMGSQFEDLESDVIGALGTVKSQFDSTKNTMGELEKIKFNKPMEAFKMFGRQIETGLLNPVGQKLLPALNGFGQWLSDHQPQIKAVGDTIGNTLGAGIEIVSGWIQKAIPYLKEFGTQAKIVFDQAVVVVKDLWAAIEPVAVLIGEQLLAAARDLWPQIQSIGTYVGEVTSAFVSWEGFIPLVAGLATAFGAYKTIVGLSVLKTKALTLATKIQTMWSNRAALATKAWNIVMSLNPIGIVIAAIIGLGVALVIAYKKSETFRNIVNKAWGAVKTAFAATMDFFKVTVPAIFNGIVNFFKTWGLTILVVLGGPIVWVVALIIKYWDQIKSFTVAVFTGIWSWLVGIWTSITSSISGAVSGIWNKITGVWNQVRSTTSSIFTGIWTFLTNIWKNILTSVTSSVTNIWNKIKGIWDKITGFLKGINLFDIGKNIIEGMINGIGSMANAVVDKVKAIGNGITDKIKGILGIHSPSRVMMELGMYTGEGLALGIEGTQDRVGQTSAGLADEVTNNQNVTSPSPATLAPARANQGGGINITLTVPVTIQGGGSQNTQQDAQNLGLLVAQEVQKILESVLRRNGLEATS
ncbi:phage tail tape measure protein [Paenibacillus macquariensis]|uniref:Phage-related minor tail protein n=1 Tax=Paenibacillus macquariensis TaxID=948756 RepID=A0ABY1JS82_9BACL|nr:phage tail tape measure protein [Paenibacillus macquariensis]MEC0092888.1 phage tail tape measure protein [Paenibacillus macquariensis]OAB36260.1 hypothetical protein PMSM_07375 [Paenibacillus macquariensis subsp. macquariensis]SIQ68180.1 Phage-related minor tail protein [Paenibacillus macquariensis]